MNNLNFILFFINFILLCLKLPLNLVSNNKFKDQLTPPLGISKLKSASWTMELKLY